MTEKQKLLISCPYCNSMNIEYDSFHFDYGGIDIKYLCWNCKEFFTHEISAYNSEYNHPEINCLVCDSDDIEFLGLKIEDTYDLTIELICVKCDNEFAITDIPMA